MISIVIWNTLRRDEKMSRRIVKTILIGTLIMALVVPVVMAQKTPFDKAREALAAKRFQEALDNSKLVIDEYPEWFWGHYLAGMSHQGLRQYDSAVREFTKSLDYAESTDESLQAKYQTAKAYYDKSDFANAARFIASAKRHRQSKFYARMSDSLQTMEGFSNYYEKKYGEAIQSFKPLVDSGKANANILKAVGSSYQELGQNSQAINIIQQVVRKDPNDLAAHKILIKSHVNSSQWSNALSAADYALRNFSSDWELHYLRGIALSKQGNTVGAIEALKRSIAISANDEVRRLLAQELMNNGQYLEATVQYDAARSSYSKDPQFHFEFAYCYVQIVPANAEVYHNKPEESRYMQALNNAETLVNIAKSLQGAGQLDFAAMQKNIDNKQERLSKGGTYTETVEIQVDPKTGKIIEKKVGDNK